MKLMLAGAGLILIIVLCSMTFMSTEAHSVQKQEIRETTRNAAYHAVQETALKKMYKIENTDEAIADFQKELIAGHNSVSDLLVKVLGVNEIDGLLHIEVIQTFHFVNGKEKKIKTEDVVILEETPR